MGWGVRAYGAGLGSVVALAVVLVAPPAGATDRAEGLRGDGVLVEEGAEPVDRAALVDAVAGVRNTGVRLSVAVLAEEPSGGAEQEADRLVDAVGGVVLVLTPAEVGAVSADHGASAVDAALDAAFAQFDDPGTVPAGVETFGRELAAAVERGADDEGIGGISTRTIVIGGIVLLAVLFVLPRLLGGGRRRRRGGLGGLGGRRRGGGFGGGFLGGLLGGTMGRRMGGPRGTTTGRPRPTPSRSRGSASRSRGSASRSRGGAGRRR